MTTRTNTPAFDLSHLDRHTQGFAHHLIGALHALTRRGKTNDDVLSGISPAPLRITLGKTFTPTNGEAHQGPSPDYRIEPLDPATNHTAGAYLHAEDIGDVMKELGMQREQAIFLLGSLPREAVGPFMDELRKGISKDGDSEAAKRRRSIEGGIQPPPAARTVDSMFSTRPASSYASAMAAEGRRRDAANAFNVQSGTSTADRSVTPVRAGRGYDPMASFKANMDAAHRAARGA